MSLNQAYAFRRVQSLLVLFTIATLTACGFHLRGAVELSDELSPVYVQQNNAYELARDISALLRSNKVELATAQSQANVSIILLRESRSARILSVDTSGRAREYLLTYNVNVQFKGKDFKAVDDAISLTRTLLFDPNTVLAVTNEQATLYREMQRDAARRILLKLQALSLQENEKAVQDPTEEHSSMADSAQP